MGFLLNCWDAISRSGTSGLSFGSEVKRLKLTNRFGIISVFFTLPYLIGFYYYGYDAVAGFLLLCCLVYASVPLLSYLGFSGLSKLVLYMMVLVHQFVVASVFGEEASIHLIYIALVLLPMVLYDHRKDLPLIFFYLLITVTAMIILFATDFSLFSVHASPTVVSWLSFSYHITTMAGVIVILATSLYVAEKTEKILGADNYFLQSQLKAIFDNSHDALFMVDELKKQVIKVNRRAMELFESEEKEMIGKYGPDFHAQPLSGKEYAEITYSLANTGRYCAEVLYKTGKGNTFWGSLVIKQITIAAKKYQVVRITDITIPHEINEKLKCSLKEKEVLLAEIHHRVKNNMAVISGLLGIQSTYIKDPEAKLLFEESRNRIHSMGLIHDKLYQHETFATINFCAYINDLVRQISTSYDSGTTDISFNISCKDIFLEIRYAVPCGLILNELISNAYKHAFAGREKGEIRIVCTKMGEKFTMMVSDNGIGYELETALKKPESLGLSLINGLVGQISGTVTTSNRSGTTFYISFEV